MSVSPATPSERSTSLAELVGGRDRGGVERRQRVAQRGGAGARRSAASASSSVASTGWSRSAAGGSASARSASTSCSRTRSRSSWLAARPKVMTSSWSSGHALLGDVAGDQRGDGEGLAGAGAGLEQGGAGRQRAGEVEGLHQSPAPLLGARVSGPHTPQRQRAEPAGLARELLARRRGRVRHLGQLATRRPQIAHVGGVGLLAGEPAVLPVVAGLDQRVGHVGAAYAAARA